MYQYFERETPFTQKYLELQRKIDPNAAKWIKWEGNDKEEIEKILD